MKHHPSILILSVHYLLSASSLCPAEENPPKIPAEVGAKPAPAATTEDRDGVWQPIAAVMSGVRLPETVLKTITLTITGDRYEVVVEGEKEPDKGTCVVDATTTPKRMTIKSEEGPNKGKTILAIFEQKNAGAMRVCYDLSGKEFPKEFKAPKGTERYLVGYRKQTPAAP